MDFGWISTVSFGCTRCRWRWLCLRPWWADANARRPPWCWSFFGAVGFSFQSGCRPWAALVFCLTAHRNELCWLRVMYRMTLRLTGVHNRNFGGKPPSSVRWLGRVLRRRRRIIFGCILMFFYEFQSSFSLGFSAWRGDHWFQQSGVRFSDCDILICHSPLGGASINMDLSQKWRHWLRLRGRSVYSRLLFHDTTSLHRICVVVSLVCLQVDCHRWRDIAAKIEWWTTHYVMNLTAVLRTVFACFSELANCPLVNDNSLLHLSQL